MMDDLAEFYDAMIAQCEKDEWDAPSNEVALALMVVIGFYRHKVSVLRRVTNARALSEVNNG